MGYDADSLRKAARPSTGAFSLIMAVKRLTDQRFHSLVRNDHSLGELSWSLPSGYR
jgi:hypothetical protein